MLLAAVRWLASSWSSSLRRSSTPTPPWDCSASILQGLYPASCCLDPLRLVPGPPSLLPLHGLVLPLGRRSCFGEVAPRGSLCVCRRPVPASRKPLNLPLLRGLSASFSASLKRACLFFLFCKIAGRCWLQYSIFARFVACCLLQGHPMLSHFSQVFCTRV